VLANVRRSGARDEEASARLVNPAAGAAFPIGDAEAAAGDGPGVSEWEDASYLIAESEEPLSDAPVSPMSESLDAIELELGLDHALSDEDIKRAKRRFMWRNHPDRRNEAQRSLADRRVAIANMLIDRARAELTAKPRKRS
jgi:hypothetical protein